MSDRNVKWNTVIPGLLLIAILVTAALTGYVYVAVAPGNPLLPSHRVTDFSDGWMERTAVVTGGEETRPEESEWGLVRTFSRRLPRALGESEMLCVETRQQALRVVVGGKIVYEAGTDAGARFGRSVGSMWNFIDLPRDAGGEMVTLYLMTNFSQVPNSLQGAVLGSEGAIVLELVRQNIGVVGFVAFTWTLGLFLICISLFMWLKRLVPGRAGFFYLGLFSILSGVWVLTDNRILQLFISNVSAIYILSFHTFMLLPIPLLLYLRTACRWNSRVPHILSLLFLLNFAANSPLHAIGVLDLLQTVMVTHLLLFITIGWIFIVCLRGRAAKERGFDREVLPPLCFLCVFAVISLLWFYLERPGDYARFFRWGLLIFILALSLGSFRRGAAMLSDSMHARYYKLLAYADAMTMLLNRTAFERDTGRLKEQAADHDSVTLLLYDLNNLKSTNDTKGHMAGDEMIMGFADCLRGVYSGTGQSYRIGGDEFAVLIYDRTEEETATLARRMEETCDIDFACGSQRNTLGSGSDIDVGKLFQDADRKMYKEKARIRKSQTSAPAPSKPEF